MTARLSEMIAVQIAELILSGKIESETKLRQEELADMLEVSRIPVREALQILEAQGLVKRLATRHIVTVELDGQKIRETYDIMALIEVGAMTEIAENLPMETLINACLSGDDMSFHRMIMEHTKNLYVQTLLTNAVRYYISYAEKLKTAESHMASLCRECGEKTREALADVIKEHYRYLAQLVIEERLKNDRTA